MDALNESARRSPGSSDASTIGSPASSSACPHPELMQCLLRQAQVMERLADLLPPLIAQNQMLIEALAEKDEPEKGVTYLDGSPIRADRDART